MARSTMNDGKKEVVQVAKVINSKWIFFSGANYFCIFRFQLMLRCTETVKGKMIYRINTYRMYRNENTIGY